LVFHWKDFTAQGKAQTVVRGHWDFPEEKQAPWRKYVMARMKRKSASVDKAKTRASSLESIDKTLDLGNGMTLAGYNKQITDTETALNDYNAKLSELDEALNDLQASEKTLDDLTERMLAGVGSKFGKDSNEYEKAGGVRKSERKAPVRKPKTKPA
jgi:galactokinase